jgi:hypothetical protein
MFSVAPFGASFPFRTYGHKTRINEAFYYVFQVCCIYCSVVTQQSGSEDYTAGYPTVKAEILIHLFGPKHLEE